MAHYSDKILQLELPVCWGDLPLVLLNKQEHHLSLLLKAFTSLLVINTSFDVKLIV